MISSQGQRLTNPLSCIFLNLMSKVSIYVLENFEMTFLRALGKTLYLSVFYVFTLYLYFLLRI